MKTLSPTLIATLCAGLLAGSAFAQVPPGPPPGAGWAGGPPGGYRGEPPQGGYPPPRPHTAWAPAPPPGGAPGWPYARPGHWRNYAPPAPRYQVLAPATGVRLAVLPAFAETLWVAGTAYYLAEGVYYRADPAGGFVAVNDPTLVPVVSSAAAQGTGYDGFDVTAYPLQGQDSQRYAQDRYDCRRQAALQVGFDPDRPGGLADPYVVAGFRQALGGCLARRGYQIAG